MREKVGREVREDGAWTVLEKEIARLYRQVAPLRYDDLIIDDHMMGRSKVKAVRDADGRIDILATFKKAGIDISVMREKTW